MPVMFVGRADPCCSACASVIYAVQMGSKGRDAPPGTHIPRYGAHGVEKLNIIARKTSDFLYLRRESALCAFAMLVGTEPQLILHSALDPIHRRRVHVGVCGREQTRYGRAQYEPQVLNFA